MIKQRTVYTYEGQDFGRLDKLKIHVENRIGEEIIEKFNLPELRLTPKQALHILRVLTDKTNRSILNEYLNVTYEVEEYNGNGYISKERNILDL